MITLDTRSGPSGPASSPAWDPASLTEIEVVLLPSVLGDLAALSAVNGLSDQDNINRAFQVYTGCRVEEAIAGELDILVRDPHTGEIWTVKFTVGR